MAGMFPAIFHRAMTGTRSDTGGKHPPAAEIPFINFVDAMFTTLIETPFTKAFDAVPPTATLPCVYRACNPD